MRLNFIIIMLLLSSFLGVSSSWSSNLEASKIYTDGKGIGGTGLLEDGKGIGGTGFVEDGKGIGGTGIKLDGDIGVYGVITGFGSIFVNDIEVFFNQKTPVDNDGEFATSKDLKIGQVVALVAHQDKGKILARNISVRPILSGKVENINTNNNSFEVMGKLVHIEGNDNLSESIKAGENISISGFTNDKGEIVATSIESQEKRAKRVHKRRNIFKNIRNFSIQGRVKEHKGSSSIYINNDIIMPLATKNMHFNKNKRMTFFGSLNKKGKLKIRSARAFKYKKHRRTFFYKRKRAIFLDKNLKDRFNKNNRNKLLQKGFPKTHGRDFKSKNIYKMKKRDDYIKAIKPRKFNNYRLDKKKFNNYRLDKKKFNNYKLDNKRFKNHKLNKRRLNYRKFKNNRLQQRGHRRR